MRMYCSELEVRRLLIHLVEYRYFTHLVYRLLWSWETVKRFAEKPLVRRLSVDQFESAKRVGWSRFRRLSQQP